MSGAIPRELKAHSNHLLLLCILPVLAWSAWDPHDRLTWWLEVIPVFAGFCALYTAQLWKSWHFSAFALWLIGIHMVILMVGGHYTYARVPLGDWASEIFGFERNHYDRLGHLAQGMIPAILCREVFIRLNIVRKRGWRSICIIFFCLAISAIYELIEYGAALCSEEAAQSFLGTQGDPWDTQNDMALALVGAIVAVTLLRWPHDRSMARLSQS